ASSTGQVSSRDGTVSGTVFFDADARPASHVAVSLRSAGQQIFRNVLTDSEGHFEVSGLPGGVYEISADGPGCISEQVTNVLRGTVANVAVHLKSYKAAPIRNGFTVSARELRLPEKARDEYQKGLARIAKSDYTESLRHLTKATQAFPEYY